MHDRRDEIAGYGPGLALAAGLAAVSGLATIAVLIAWLHVAGISGTFRPEAGGILAATAWWIAFWLGLSAGLLASLWLGYRGWRVLYPVQQRREVAREERDAVAAAEAIVERARTTGARER
ncbi:MAG: hypothetical protein AB7F65_01500 [Dehalococcoidia bacterium]